MASYSFAIESALRASPERLWDHASSFKEINLELWPLRMSHPAAVPRLTPEAIPLGRRAFRSWILLFGLIPVEYDDFTIVELEPGRGYIEDHASLNRCLLIFSARIFDSSVDAGSPSFLAAPDEPEIRPLASAKAASIIVLSSAESLFGKG